MYYCKHCEKVVNKDEIEIVEGRYEGDWVEVHTKCGEEVQFI